MSNETNLDKDDYPTKACLSKIATWPHDDPMGWFDFIFHAWAYPAEGWEKDDSARNRAGLEVNRFSISTSGWSGNEEIIEAMQKNYMLWTLHWEQTRRGGHYIFEVKK